MPFVVAIYVVLFSHLTVDRDFPQNVKIGSYIVFGVVGVAYFLTKVVF